MDIEDYANSVMYRTDCTFGVGCETHHIHAFYNLHSIRLHKPRRLYKRFVWSAKFSDLVCKSI